MEKITLNFKGQSDFIVAWILDGIANSADKGVKNNVAKADELMADAKELYTEGDEAHNEVVQSKLNRLASRIEMHEEQAATFAEHRDQAAKAYCQVTGKKAWTAYVAGGATPKDATATNAFFAKRLAS
jgi:hypothetical protein